MVQRNAGLFCLTRAEGEVNPLTWFAFSPRIAKVDIPSSRKSLAAVCKADWASHIRASQFDAGFC